MLNSELASQEHLFPPGFQREFDAHVYYAPEARTPAERLREKVIVHFKNTAVFVGELVDRKVGPHPLPMFELNFPKSLLEEVTRWLEEHRGSRSVLVHEVTGDDPKDHSTGAKWLGKKLDLDESKLHPSP